MDQEQIKTSVYLSDYGYCNNRNSSHAKPKYILIPVESFTNSFNRVSVEAITFLKANAFFL